MATTANRPQRRPRHDPKDTEREILDATETLLGQRPFRDITVEQIMNLTELKRPAFYVHFRDRHEVTLRAVQRITDELFAMTGRWLDGDQPLLDVRSAIEGIVALYVEHGPVLRALGEAATSDAGIERAYRDLVQSFIDVTAEQIREDQAAGRIDNKLDADANASALIWLNERYFSETLGRQPQADPAMVVEVLHHIWTSTLYSSLDR